MRWVERGLLYVLIVAAALFASEVILKALAILAIAVGAAVAGA